MSEPDITPPAPEAPAPGRPPDTLVPASPSDPSWTSLREQFGPNKWLIELAWALLVLTLGVADPATEFSIFHPEPLLILVALIAAVIASRKWPAVALGILWLSGIAQTSQHVAVSLAQLAVIPVAYGCARYGKTLTVIAAGVSMPLAAALGLYYVNEGGWSVLDYRLGDLFNSVRNRSDTLTLLGAAALLTLMIPFLLGLLTRALARTRTAETARDKAQARVAMAQEIADLRESQASLARDVHDVVGHSLAVILAQAESAQFFADDHERLRSTLATIATSARGSLADIRHVLDQTSKGAPVVTVGAFSDLIEGVRASGREVTVTDVGTPRPLPPELQVVAHRVMQEMLTNAVRHGDGSQPIDMTRFWDTTLCIQVRNYVAKDPADARPGSGIGGMYRRLESVGGTLTTAREGDSFVATAWMPTGGQR